MEVPPPKRVPKGSGSGFVSIPAAITLDGDFTWDPDHAPDLVDLNLRVATGQLVVVVGHTGCGKSSLLNAVLGMMTPVGGTA